MSVTKVAYRYAQALIDLAAEINTVEEVYGDMNQLASVCEESRDFRALLNSPVIVWHKKQAIFKQLFEKSISEMSMGFMNLIAKNSRENLLPEIAEGYIQLYKKSKNIHEVYVTSAVALDQSTKDKIIEKIKAEVNGTIELTETVDPELIGGFIVRMEDKQIDASISSQLADLRNVLLN
ncbi:MAG: ATP synthase F1 subunit delta [Crocinitomicaceae bacterium]